MSENFCRSWIESKLSLNERNELFDTILEETTSPTGEQILNTIQELFPKKKNLPSVRAINKWKAQRWSFVMLSRMSAAIRRKGGSPLMAGAPAPRRGV